MNLQAAQKLYSSTQKHIRPNSALGRKNNYHPISTLNNSSLNKKSKSKHNPVLLDSSAALKYASFNKKFVPNQTEKEQMYLENLSLRYQIKLLKEEVSSFRAKFVKNDEDMTNKNRLFDEIYKASAQFKGDISGNESFFQKVTQSHLLDRLKEKYKEVKENLRKKEKEIEDLKATLKMTKINELENQNKIYFAEIERLVNIIRNTDPQELENATKMDIITSKNLMQNSINKGFDSKNTMDKKISTLVEQNSFIQNEMVEIHKIILEKKSNNFSPNKYIQSSTILAKTGFNFTIINQNTMQNFNKKRTYDDSIDENFQKFLGESGDDFMTSQNNQMVKSNNKIFDSLHAQIEAIKKENDLFKAELALLKNGNNKIVNVNDNTLNNLNNNLNFNKEKQLSLKEIQKNFLENEKFKLSVVFIMRAALLAKNINYAKFVKLFKLDKKEEITEDQYRTIFHKQFYNLALISDIYDYFAVDILIKDILQNFNNKEKLNTKIKKIFFKNLPENFEKFVKTQLKSVFELKEIFIKKSSEFRKHFYENENAIIKYKTLKSYLKSYSSSIKKEQIFALIFLMKLYTSRESTNLGFYDLNCQLIFDLTNKRSSDTIFNTLKNIILPSENDINTTLNRIYNPHLEIKLSEIFFILHKYENYSSLYIRKKITFYLKLKGVELNKKQKFTLEKIIENGILQDTVNNHLLNETDGQLKFNYTNTHYDNTQGNQKDEDIQEHGNMSESENYNILEGEDDLSISNVYGKSSTKLSKQGTIDNKNSIRPAKTNISDNKTLIEGKEKLDDKNAKPKERHELKKAPLQKEDVEEDYEGGFVNEEIEEEI